MVLLIHVCDSQAPARRRIFKVADAMKSWEFDKFSQNMEIERTNLIRLDETTKDAKSEIEQKTETKKKTKRSNEFEQFQKMAPAILYGPSWRAGSDMPQEEGKNSIGNSWRY